MGQRDRSTSNEVLLLTNLCRHHEQTIAQMFAIQEPILRYARAMRFVEEYPDYVESLWEDNPLDAIEENIDYWEEINERPYTIDWEDV